MLLDDFLLKSLRGHIFICCEKDLESTQITALSFIQISLELRYNLE